MIDPFEEFHFGFCCGSYAFAQVENMRIAWIFCSRCLEMEDLGILLDMV
jgi:hypothetical protein